MARQFLSDTDANYKCLEDHLAAGEFDELPDAEVHQMQHPANASLAVMEIVKQISPNFFGSDSLAPHLKRLNERLDSVALPTRYDAPGSYHLIDGLVSRIKHAAEALGWNRIDFPLYASVPTGQVNAVAVDLPCSSQPFLLFDDQLLTFCNLMAKVYAQCLFPLPGTQTCDKQSIEATIACEPALAHRLAAILDAFIRTGRPAVSSPFPVDARSARLASYLREGMELFVVGHEFGHVYAGHLAGAGRQAKVAEKHGISFAHSKEFEADYIGMILAIKAFASEGEEPWLVMAAIRLFFSSLDLVNRYAGFTTHGPEAKFTSQASETHPSNENRLKGLDYAFSKLCGAQAQLDNANAYAELMDHATTCLWEAMQSPHHHT